MRLLFLIFAVMGTILLGWAAPTEAAALGAFGAVILTTLEGERCKARDDRVIKHRLLARGRMRSRYFSTCCRAFA